MTTRTAQQQRGDRGAADATRLHDTSSAAAAAAAAGGDDDDGLSRDQLYAALARLTGTRRPSRDKKSTVRLLP